ncbi:nucleoside/nucleotide kinase family protein [Saccharopolyspora sp. TS4A08]|uniref:Nucleoside/nucleotide kinase family protein n=1 Tax=Saccharopolyspora ipomoeae TaxID=3042027 RepID=A0ABT6PKK9_9PSEU|nr:nucleoside/nucleotide kinase family protein [Saccharopolyspora sp. TS4A08]MDI2028535.1 nucleoside/nucleotide kinase family protein [Saccharopolyspora sp. TS4A08]
MYSELISRAKRLADGGQRRVLGIAGAPGAGKGTVAERVMSELGDRAVLVPMDGFHLANAQLRRLGRAERKGAPDTFDAAGYVALLRRIREGAETVFAPNFHREIEESFAAEIAVDPEVPLVITEGNYLLLDTPPWAPVRGLLDECWFLAPDDEQRVQRLVDRHVHYGRTPEEAAEWVQRSDERNAAIVAATRDRADLVIDGDPS